MKAQELLQEVKNEFDKWNEILLQIDNKIGEMKVASKKWSIKDILGHLVFWTNFSVETVELRLQGQDISQRNKIKEQFATVNEKVWEKIQTQNYPKVRNEFVKAMNYCVEFIQQHEAELTEEDIDEILEAIYHQRHHRAAVKNILREIKDHSSS